MAQFEVDPEVFAFLGAEVWRPSFAYGTKVGRVPLSDRPWLVVCMILGAALLAYGAAMLAIGEASYALYVVAGCFALVPAVWIIGFHGNRVAVVPLAVHERGIVVPKTAQSVPGLQRVGGPRAFRRGEVMRAARVEEGGHLALLITTSVGSTALIDKTARRPELTDAELKEAVDGMCAALEEIGVPVARGGMELIDAERAPAAP